MGRRKIEIKAIKDDRNRSVTFLKRKGGLFKKAHELSVLCSVDVAVIVFGQNKKLYEFSSGNIHDTLWRHQQYAGAHEHKGPNDFADKGDNDDEDEDEENMGSPLPDDPSPPHHGVVPQHYANHPGVQQMRHTTPSASPPMPNGVYGQRMSTPQPQNLSRPSSRNTHGRRPSSNLVPQNHPQPQAAQGYPQHLGYSNQPNAQYYQHMQPATTNVQINGHQGHPQMAQHHQYSHPMHAQQNQMQQVYMQETRRQSLPSTLPPQQQQQQQQQDRQAQGMPFQSPPIFQRPFQSPPLPEPKPGQPQRAQPAPQDDMHYAEHMRQDSHVEDLRHHAVAKSESAPRSQSVDVGSALRHREETASKESFAPPPVPQQPPSRSDSMSNPSNFGQTSRVNSISSEAKRPRLKVQIPSEHSDGGSATGESSPKESGATATPKKNTDSSHSPNVVLPPPSPSASAILSAGASGPKNPFARPPPPSSAIPNGDRMKDAETPISALPSRFVSDGLLPSPSSFYPEWGFGHVSSANPNNLASPAPYQPTPINTHGPSFRDEDPDKKRKSPEEGEGSTQKKIKT